MHDFAIVKVNTNNGERLGIDYQTDTSFTVISDGLTYEQADENSHMLACTLNIPLFDDSKDQIIFE